MGRFKAEAILVRELEELTIIFYDKESIYVYPKKEKWGTIFNRWGVFQYGDWQDFRRRLMRKKHLDLRGCYELALKYEILAVSTARRLNLEGKKVRKI